MVFTKSVWFSKTGRRWLVVDDIEMAKTWYIFWVFPAAFFLLNRLIRPRYYETLYTNRVMKFYPILILALLTFLLLFLRTEKQVERAADQRKPTKTKRFLTITKRNQLVFLRNQTKPKGP